MKPMTKTLLWITAFSVAMGFLETSVVVYLRELYYPEGFRFPLTPIDPDIALTEFLREAATIVMLVCAGALAGKNFAQRFAFFIYSFAIWDIFYYVFLKLLLGWPESFLTWDILFLIPVPWVGPVLAPCMVALTMVALSLSVVHFSDKGYQVNIRFTEWTALIFGSLVAIVSFIWDYVMYVYKGNPTDRIWTLSSKEQLFSEIANYVPQHFNWGMFLAGEALLLLGTGLFIYRMKLKPYSK